MLGHLLEVMLCLGRWDKMIPEVPSNLGFWDSFVSQLPFEGHIQPQHPSASVLFQASCAAQGMLEKTGKTREFPSQTTHQLQESWRTHQIPWLYLTWPPHTPELQLLPVHCSYEEGKEGKLVSRCATLWFGVLLGFQRFSDVIPTHSVLNPLWKRLLSVAANWAIHTW